MKAISRCSKHDGWKVIPALCHTCQRINVERKIIEKTIDVLLKAGYGLQTDQSGDALMPEDGATTNRAEIVPHLMETDDERLIVCIDGRAFGWIRFVYGNDGYDVISDYTMNLDDALTPVQDFATTFEN